MGTESWLTAKGPWTTHPWIICNCGEKTSGTWIQNKMVGGMSVLHRSSTCACRLPGLYFCGLLPHGREVLTGRGQAGLCVEEQEHSCLWWVTRQWHNFMKKKSGDKISFWPTHGDSKPRVIWLKKGKTRVGRRGLRCVAWPLLFVGEKIIVSVH